MVPACRSAGSLQVVAASPVRAAALPLMNTVELPSAMVPLFEGGFTNVPPIGIWDGVLVAVLSLVAAAIPIMFTSELKLPSICPANGCGVSTGGDVGGG